MRLSPIVLSAATAWLSPSWCTAVAVASSGTHNDLDHHRSREIRDIRTGTAEAIAAYPAGYHHGNHPSAELSTEFFLLPDIIEKNEDLASVASVISVPTPNRTISIYRGSGGGRTRNGGGYPVDDITRIQGGVGVVGVATQPLLRQRPWALPLAALSAAAMLLMAGFEIFVLLKVDFFY